jgi:phage shock protein A
MPDEPTPTPVPTSDPPAEPTADPPAGPTEATDPVPLPPAQSTTTQPVEPVDTGYTASGVPTFESVREKIETRYGTAIGATELDADTPEGRTVEEQYEARQRAAAERLAQIRDSMGKPEGESQ